MSIKERTMSKTGMAKLLLSLSLSRVQGRTAEQEKGLWAGGKGVEVCLLEGGGFTTWLLLMMGW